MGLKPALSDEEWKQIDKLTSDSAYRKDGKVNHILWSKVHANLPEDLKKFTPKKLSELNDNRERQKRKKALPKVPKVRAARAAVSQTPMSSLKIAPKPILEHALFPTIMYQPWSQVPSQSIPMASSINDALQFDELKTAHDKLQENSAEQKRQLVEEKEDAVKQSQEAQKKYEELKTMYDKRVSALELTNQLLAEDVEAAEELNANLKTQNDSLVAEHALLKKKIEDAVKQSQEAQKKYEELKTMYDRCQTLEMSIFPADDVAYDKLKTKYETLVVEHATLKMKFEGTEKERIAAQAALDDKSKMLQDLQTKLDLKTSECDTAVAEATQKNTECENALKKFAEVHEELTRHLASAKEERLALSAPSEEHRNLMTKYDKLKTLFNDFKTKYVKLETQYKELKTQHGAFVSEWDKHVSLKKRLEEAEKLASESDEAKAELGKSEEKLRARNQKIQQMTESIQDLQAELDRNVQLVKDLRSRSERTSKHCERAQGEAKDLKRQLASAKRELQAAQKTLDDPYLKYGLEGFLRNKFTHIETTARNLVKSIEEDLVEQSDVGYNSKLLWPYEYARRLLEKRKTGIVKDYKPDQKEMEEWEKKCSRFGQNRNDFFHWETHDYTVDKMNQWLEDNRMVFEGIDGLQKCQNSEDTWKELVSFVHRDTWDARKKKIIENRLERNRNRKRQRYQ